MHVGIQIAVVGTRKTSHDWCFLFSHVKISAAQRTRGLLKTETYFQGAVLSHDDLISEDEENSL